MQPVAYPIPQESLARAWRVFMESGQIERDGDFIPDPAVLQSWRRCSPRLDPLTSPHPNRANPRALASILKAQADLIAVATPFMEDIHQFIEGSGCAVLLADGTACILSIVGDASTREALDESGLGKGTYWPEGQMGTNALGLVLVEAMPIMVAGAEHYHQVHHDMTSTAAPVHDVRGRIIGMVAIVGPVEIGTSHTLALVMAAARAISNQLQSDWLLNEVNVHLTEVNSILGEVSEGVIAWDESGKIHHVNAQAGEILHLNPASILGRSLTDALDLPPIFVEAMENNSELRDEETSFWANGRNITCLASLRPISKGVSPPVRYIALLRPIEQVRRLIHQQMGTSAMLTLDDLPSQSVRMRQVLRQARIAARGTAPVLLRGEGGVGKNHLARAIHNDSQRTDKPFVVVDCRAIPHELMAREFLGQEKDALIDGRPSKFELADGGTLLLDQIESLSLELQISLLRILETSHVMRLGGTHAIPVDVRIMAATTTDLQQRVAEGNFISHLYYRFGVFNIEIPPVRERAEDVPLMAERFLARISDRDDRPYWVDEEASAVLCRYPWPGNVREMESALERAMSLSQEGTIRVIDLPAIVRSGRVLDANSAQPEPVFPLAEVEREAIIRAGWACHGRVTEMARQLGVGRTTLWRKMKRLNISADDFKR